mgnify:CR=1 FL=1
MLDRLSKNAEMVAQSKAESSNTSNKQSPSTRKTSWLKNLRDWYGVDMNTLFRIAVNKIKIAMMLTNVLKEHGT